MRDNKPMEMIAEHLIAHFLQRHKFRVTKPYFDQDAGDLFAMTDEGGDRFCRIQCKGRTVRPGKDGGNTVEIACSHVKDQMIVVLYVDDGSFDAFHLFVFFKNDVEAWKKGKSKKVDVHRLKLTHSTFAKNLQKNRVTEAGFERLANEIMNVKLPITSSFRYTSSVVKPITMSGTATTTTTGKVAGATKPKKATKKK